MSILLDDTANHNLTIASSVGIVRLDNSTSFLVNNAGTLTINTGIKSNTTSATTLTLGGTNASGSTIITGVLQDNATGGVGALSLIVNTAGKVTLSGANTYTGNTAINGGVLSLGIAQGTTTGPLGGGTGSLPTGLISFGGGRLQYSSVNATDYSSKFSTAASQLINIDTNGQNVTFASALTSSGGTLTLNDTNASTGILTLSGAGANTYSGLTSVKNGELDLGKTSAIAVAGPLTVGDGSGAADTAIAKLLSSNQIATGTAVTINSDGKFDLNNSANTVASLTSTGGDITSTTAGGNLTSTVAPAFSGAGNKIGAGATVTSSATATLAASGSLAVNGTLADSLTTASGSTLSGTGSISGTTSVTGGTVNGTGLTWAGLATFNGGGNTMTGTVTANGGVALASGAALANSATVTGGVAVSNGTLTGNGSFSGASTLNGGTINLSSGGSFGSTLGVTGGNWNGVGSVTGLVTSSSGTFNIGSGANLTANGGLNVTGGSIVAGNSLSTITGSVNYTSGSSSTYAGAIAGSSKTLTLNNAAATLELTGASSYTGGTTVTAGNLKVNNTTGTGTGSGAVVVQNGAFLSGGNGTGSTTAPGGASLGVYASGVKGIIGGALTINSGGHLAPGNSVGTLTTASLTLDLGSIANYEFNGTANDFTAVSGLLTLNGGGFNLYQDGTNTAFDAIGTYDLLSYGSLAGALTNLSVLNQQAGFTYTFINDSTDKLIQLQIAVVPEPGTWAMMLGGLAVLIVWQRRKHKLS